MQRIEEDRIEKESVGLAEAIGRILIFRLNCDKIFPRYCASEDHFIMYFEDEIIDYSVEVSEDGCCVIKLENNSLKNYDVYFPTTDIVVSNSDCVFNPIYDPEKIITKVVKCCRFIRDLKDHMANANRQWLADGIRAVVNGSKEVCTFEGWPDPLWVKKPTFTQQYLGKFV